MTVEPFGIDVQCESGYGGEQEPPQVQLGMHRVKLVDIVDR